jgi:hypothetical protein
VNQGLARLLTAHVVLLLASFAVYSDGLLRLAASRRPRTAIYDRDGELLQLTENPDYDVK